MEERKKTITQQGNQIAQLAATVEELKEDASDTGKNEIKTKDDLTHQVSKLECALTEKDEQNDSLLKQYNLLVHNNKENEETIASLLRDLEHCQCMCINVYCRFPKSSTEIKFVWLKN